MSEQYNQIKFTTGLTPASTTASQTSASVDTQGFNGARFVLCWDGAGGNLVCSLRDSATSGGGYGAVSGFASVTASSAGAIALDVYKPRERYLKAVVTKADATATDMGGVFELYQPTKQPMTNTGGVAVSPA